MVHPTQCFMKSYSWIRSKYFFFRSTSQNSDKKKKRKQKTKTAVKKRLMRKDCVKKRNKLSF